MKKKPMPVIISSTLLNLAENLYKRGNLEVSAEVLEFLGRGNKDMILKKLKQEWKQGKKDE